MSGRGPDNGSDATTWDGSALGADATTWDGGRGRDGQVAEWGPGAAPGQYVRVQLPPSLASRFEVVEELNAEGSEADVVRATDRRSGARRVLKLYRKGKEPDEDAMRLLAGEDREHRPDKAHVVEVFEAGCDAGCWYEVQEYCRHGSLRAALQGGYRVPLDRVVRELASALAHVHGLGLVHRDVKPDNIFVRALQPELDLVLGDFGLVRSLDGSVLWTRAWGTPAYAPPELEGGEVSPAWDWWSMGMVVAEMAGGRHPFEAAGELLNGQQIRAWLAQRPVDLSAVVDPRVTLLCRGLLTRDRRHRWGATQVESWLAGGSPRVVDTTVSNAARARLVRFDDREIDDPAQLAAAFQRRWGEAFERLFQDRDQVLVTETERLLRQHGMGEAVRLLTATLSVDGPVARFAALLVEMDPYLDPEYNGVRVTLAGLRAAAQEVVNADRVLPLERALTEIRSHGVLVTWRHLEGVEHGPDTQQSWRRAHERLAQVFKQRGPDKLEEPYRSQVRGLVLGCIVDPDGYLPRLESALADLGQQDVAAQQSWWAQLRGSDDPVDRAVALLAHHLALEATRAQAEEAAQRRCRADEEQARQDAERRQREREEAIRAAAERRVRRRRQVAAVDWLLAMGLSFPGIFGLFVSRTLASSPVHLEPLGALHSYPWLFTWRPAIGVAVGLLVIDVLAAATPRGVSHLLVAAVALGSLAAAAAASYVFATAVQANGVRAGWEDIVLALIAGVGLLVLVRATFHRRWAR